MSSVGKLTGLFFSATELRDITDWDERVIEDYLALVENIRMVANGSVDNAQVAINTANIAVNATNISNNAAAILINSATIALNTAARHNAVTLHADTVTQDTLNLAVQEIQVNPATSLSFGAMTPTQVVTLSTAIQASEKGVANGVATLDGGGTVPLSQIPSSVIGGITVIGNWNADTNVPDLSALVLNQGQAYIVSVAGNTNLNGETNWKAKDLAVWSDSLAGNYYKLDNTDDVLSVNTKTGVVVLNADDIDDAATVNKWNIAHTGEVTGSSVLTITNNAVTNSKAADMPALTMKGNNTLASGDPLDLTVPEVQALLNLNTADIYETVWAEEQGALANGNNEWSFGNGSTGAIGIIAMYSGQIKKAFIQAETAGASATIDIMINKVSAGTASYAAANGVFTFGIPIDFVEGDEIGFQTNTIVGVWNDVRVGVGLVQEVTGLKGDTGATGPAGGGSTIISDYIEGTTNNPSSTAANSGAAPDIPEMTKTFTPADADNVIDVFFSGTFHGQDGKKGGDTVAVVGIFIDGTLQTKTERASYCAVLDDEKPVSIMTQWSGSLSVVPHTISVRYWLNDGNEVFASADHRNLIIKETDE